MKLRQIEVFHAVYATGSISAAARQLNVSQPAVTSLLRHTEDQLGFALFDRVRGRLVATADAHALFAQAEDIQGQVYRFRETARNIRKGRGTALRVSTLPSLGMELLPRAVTGFLAQREGISIELHTVHHDDMAVKLYERQTDLVICYSLPRETPVASTVLGEAQMCAFYREEDMPEAPSPLPLEHLTDRRYVSTNESGPQGRAIAAEFAARDVSPEVVGASRTFSIAAALAASGLGMTIVDEHTARAMLRPGLAARPLAPAQHYRIHAAYLETSPPARVALDFLDYLREQLAAHNPIL